MDQEVLKELVYRGHETVNLDYKRDMVWEKPTKYSLIKDIIAFANRGGGWIVVGVDEKGKTPEEQRTGVGKENLATWEVTKVSTDVNNYAGPPINLELVHFLDSDEEKQYIVISIPSHGETPHICINHWHNDKQKPILRKAALYIRTDNKESAEISDPAEYGALIRRCTVNDGEKLIGDIQALVGLKHAARFEATTQKDTQKPFARMEEYKKRAMKYDNLTIESPVFQELLAYPAIALEAFDVQSAKAALAQACVDYRGWPFLFFLPRDRYNHSPEYTDKMIFAHADASPGWREKADFWAFGYNGTFYSRKLTPESSLCTPSCFDPFLQVQLMGEAIIAMGRLYRGLGLPFDCDISLACRYSPLKDYRVENVVNLRFGVHPGPQFAGTQLSLTSSERVGYLLGNAPMLASMLVASLMKKTGYEGGVSEDSLREHSEKKLKGGKRLIDLNWVPTDDAPPTS